MCCIVFYFIKISRSALEGLLTHSFTFRILYQNI